MANQAEVGMKVATIEKLRREKEAVAADRLAQYPDATKGHTNLGLAWTGLLQNHYGIKLDHPIPAHVVLLMLGANKHNRAVLPTPTRIDDYIDASHYAELAYDAKQTLDSAELGSEKNGESR